MRVASCLSGGVTLLLGLLLAGLTFAASAGENELATALDKVTRTSFTSFAANSDKWAGVVFPQPPSSGHFTAVQGSFKVPKISVPVEGGVEDDWQAAVHVGFGGTTDNNNYWVQAGVLLYIRPSENTMFRAFHVWYPNSDPIFDDGELDISEGDQLTLRVESYSNNSGIAIIENHATGKGVHKILSSPPDSPPLLGKHAEWFVSEPVNNQLADFGTVDFTDAVAYTSDGKNIGPGEGGALVATIQEDRQLMTETVVLSRGLTVAYKPHPKQERRVLKRATDPNRPCGHAGARFVKPFPGGDYRAIQGTFTVPQLGVPLHPVNHYHIARASVRIGGTAQDEEPSSSVGLDLIVEPYNGSVWHEWYQPFFKMGGVEHNFTDLQVNPGDTLTLRLELDNSNGTSGRGTITKLNGQNVSVTLTGGDPVQGYHAEWIVADPMAKSMSEAPACEPFTGFGSVNFTGAFVETANGTHLDPGYATSEYLVTQLISSPGLVGVPMTHVTVGPNLVNITYIQIPT